MSLPSFSSSCQVAVIGAGPYGLAIAAHLMAAKISIRVFGDAMSFWRDHMPKGMLLHSPWVASDIADPDSRLTLGAFADEHLVAQQEHLPLEQFVRYGEWFQRSAVSLLDTRKVLSVQGAEAGYRLILDDHSSWVVKRVVVATGLAHHEFRPRAFHGLPAELASHTCDHSNLGKWPGKRVAVVGQGQSAYESVGLLRKAGSEVELICRGEIRWSESPPFDRGSRSSLVGKLRQLLQAPSAVRPFPWNCPHDWPFVEGGVRARLRAIASSLQLGASARWPREEFEGVVVLSGKEITHARANGTRVAVTVSGSAREYDHVLLATGYRTDVSNLSFLPPWLRAQIALSDGAPNLRDGCESTAPGLHFVGCYAAHSYGPLMRFVAGSGLAARSVTRKVLLDGTRSRHVGRSTSANQPALSPAALTV